MKKNTANNQNQKTCKVTFRLTEKEKNAFMDRSKKAYMSPSEFLRKSIRDSKIITRLSPKELEIYKHLTRIGHNINTLLKLAHIANISTVESQCQEAISEINKHLKHLSDDRQNSQIRI